MKYYWSCWFNKEELKSMGAINLLSAVYDNFFLVPNCKEGYYAIKGQNQYIFRAEDSFPLFLKLKSDKHVVEVTKRYYSALDRGDSVKVGNGSKTGRAIRSCILDF
jgi:hypothetical protein